MNRLFQSTKQKSLVRELFQLKLTTYGYYMKVWLQKTCVVLYTLL